MKTFVTPLLSLCLLLAGEAVAQAQAINNPTVTPWRNLYNGGSTPLNNYFNQVRPELDFRASIFQLQRQTAANQQGLSNLAATPAGPLVTGHQAGFMTQNSYFQTLGAGGAGSAGGTGSGFGTVGRSGSSASPARH